MRPFLASAAEHPTVEELLGHRDIKATMVYTHVLNRGRLGVQSPLDRLRKPISVDAGGLT
jgi:integrase